jgi:hypothetical protein
MSNSEGDIAGFLREMRLGPSDQRRKNPYLGIDECLNRTEITDLVRSLVSSGLVNMAGPLWYQTRERDGVIVCSVLGGIDRDSMLKEPNALIHDIGVPVKHHSWSDFRVAQMLVAHFISHDNLILLSENTKKDQRGLRRILNKVVAPALALRPEPLCLVALFKKGKTTITDYCRRVGEFVREPPQHRGYVEVLF